jgi:hypothetical protein
LTARLELLTTVPEAVLETTASAGLELPIALSEVAARPALLTAVPKAVLETALSTQL